MALNMYLNGDEQISESQPNSQSNHIEDGYQLISRRFLLGYWQNKSGLHDYIVRNYSDQDPDYAPIYLDSDDIEEIISAISEDRLPPTVGRSFEESTNDEAHKSESLSIFTKALQWLHASQENRSISYEASW